MLFERLGTTSGKKTAKTRVASTAEDVLEELALVHELPRKILAYRYSIQKLRSRPTWTPSPSSTPPEDGPHPRDLQPDRGGHRPSLVGRPQPSEHPDPHPRGAAHPRGLRADPGFRLLSADYSQIELRILAHLSRDETLIDTFRRGEDVHDRTAREVFGPLSAIPPDEQRRIAKMVNYALLYGKTAFTLAKDLSVSRGEAQSFIEAYFDRYPRVRGFIDKTIADARERAWSGPSSGGCGDCRTCEPRAGPVRMEAERQAMNTPVSRAAAADLIKRAMIDLSRDLGERTTRPRLILQIHDELLLEVPGE